MPIVAPNWTRKSYGKRVDLLRISPSRYRVYVDGKPLAAVYDHKTTGHMVALAIADALREIEQPKAEEA